MQKQDDRYKWGIRDFIIDYLYKPVQTIRDNELKRLILLNCYVLTKEDRDKGKVDAGHAHASFGFNGKFYNIDIGEGPPVRNKVHKSLVDEVKTLVQTYDIDILGHEKALVSGYITSMLSFSRSPADYLLMLPQPLHSVVKHAVSTDWAWHEKTPEQCEFFVSKYQKGYELIRQRLAFNLIL